MGRNRCSAGQLAESGRTADRHVRTGTEPEIDTMTLDDIEHDVPAPSGDKSPPTHPRSRQMQPIAPPSKQKRSSWSCSRPPR